MTAAPDLRPYQADVRDRVAAEIAAGHRRVIVAAPTASGKTVIAGAIVADAVRLGQRVLFLAHRRELITQASRKLHAAGVEHGIILASYPARPSEPVQVASVATLHARAVRTASMDMPPADLVIIDEAHHVRARTYQKILAAYPGAIVIGLTATPCRGDGRGLGSTFNALVECPPVIELTAAGYLVPATIYAPSQPDLSGVRVERGDYVERQLAERVDTAQLVGDIVEHWHRLAGRRRTVIFATGVAHAVHLRDEFRRAGVLAEHLDGSTPHEERDAILARLAAGTIEVVTNAMVLTEGWDCPDVGCLVLARPTKSLGLYRQMVGRVLRPAPGKVDALILDHAGAVFAHGFPDDPIKWELAEDRRAENKAHAARGSYRAPALTTCPECAAVRFEGKPCPACDWRPRPKAAPVEVADGELGRVARNRTVPAAAITADERTRFYGMLLYVANERGYARGWAGHKFREKFGDWPASRFVDPVPPDDAMRSWVRSRQIAYAKAMQKAGAA
jgi:superfamily II DNA or RNA helicase